VNTQHQGQAIAQYRKSKNWSQEDLAGALRVDTRTVQRMEKQSMIKNIERRQLLVGLLSIPVALMGLEVEQQLSQKTSVVANHDRMSFFEEEIATRWDVYHTGGTLRASRGLAMWLGEMTNFARSAQGSVWHERALSLLSMSYQLQSSVSRDMMQYDLAHTAFKKAYRIAKELNDSEMMAASLAREGVTLIQQDQAAEAIRFLTAAYEITKGGKTPFLRGFILQALSEAYAKTGQHQECWQCITLAERILERPEHAQERNLTRFNIASITAQKGVDAVILKDYDRAIVLIDKSLVHYDPTRIRGRARLIAQKAEAYHGLGMLDASMMTAEEALILAHSVGSDRTVARIRQLHATLATSSGKEPSVARLGTLLTQQR